MMDSKLFTVLLVVLCLSTVGGGLVESHNETEDELLAKDCQTYYERGERTNGVYIIGDCFDEKYEVACEFSDDNGWTVIQKRRDGSVDFKREWAEYKYGFGSAAGEYWLGNERLYILTQTNQKLNIYVKAADGSHGSGTWQKMHIHDESDKYRIFMSGSGYIGDLRMNGFFYHNNMQFSTSDQDHDSHQSHCANSYRDCQTHYERGERTNGVYIIGNCNEEKFKVRCEFSDNNGWTVIQKRLDGSVDFNRRWADYKYGFGSAAGEYWLGNERLYFLTQTNQKLHIYVTTADGSSGSGTWQKMHIHDESDKYRLSMSAYGYTGDLPISGFFYHNNMQFTTTDQDHDNYWANCAETGRYKAGWWFDSCTWANLNGHYNQNNTYGVTWIDFSESLIQTTMRITRD